ncbi:MAG: FecR domain-containing protein [Alphaproteobacteria bacterium]
MRYCALIPLAGFFASGAQAAATSVGVAAGVVGAVNVSEGERTASEPVMTGMAMQMRDRVKSQQDGRVQLLLMDQTVFTIGPNSDLVIDEFVYDPASGVGRVSANFTKGMMRYVSGRIGAQDPQGITIKARDATIGVRGTALFVMDDPTLGDGTQFIGLLGPGIKNDSSLKAGSITVSTENKSVDVVRAGFGVFVTPGQEVGPPVATPARLIQSLARDLTGEVRLADGAVKGASGEQANTAEGSNEESDEDWQSGESGTIQGYNLAEESRSLSGLLGIDVELAELAIDYYSSLADIFFNTRDRSLTASEVDRILRDSFAQLPNLTGALPDKVVIPGMLVLTWKNAVNNLRELDLHLTGPDGTPTGRFHVFHGNPGNYTAPPFSLLDRDNFARTGETSGEVIGLSDSIARLDVDNGNSLFRAIVFNTTDRNNPASTALSDPGNEARVRLIAGGVISRTPTGSAITSGLAVLDVRPIAGQIGHTWTVLDTTVSGADPVINIVDNRFDDGLGVTIEPPR